MNQQSMICPTAQLAENSPLRKKIADNFNFLLKTVLIIYTVLSLLSFFYLFVWPAGTGDF